MTSSNKNTQAATKQAVAKKVVTPVKRMAVMATTVNNSIGPEFISTVMDRGSKATVGKSKTPIYQNIKNYVLSKVQDGSWLEGAAIPSEQALAKTFDVSRMTVNRAVSELANEGVLNRIQGSGTFVAPRKYQAMLLQIQNIADEVSARGHTHRSDLQLLERCKADDFLATQFKVPLHYPLFHSVVVHYENELAIQVEDRYVNPAVAPNYLTYDFQSHTPNEYLMQVAPLQAVKFTIEACMPPATISTLLHCAAAEPCLVLRRHTYSQSQTASYATLWHPAARYKFAGNF